jgi:hypothetical protein
LLAQRSGQSLVDWRKMSTFEDQKYRWRETYFVLFDVHKRPKLHTVAKAIQALNERFELKNLSADEHERIESLTVISAEDYAAMDICFTSGDEVREQATTLVADLKKSAGDTGLEVPEKRLLSYSGRFDVLHFERIDETAEEEEEEMLDPSALLIVLETLARLTGGVAVDPQSGTILDSGD